MLFGTNMNDASRWIEIPFVGLTLQTSDFAKVALVIWVAKELHLRREYLDDFRNEVVPILYRIVFVCGLILPADLSTALMLGAVTVGMMFVGGVPIRGLFRIGGLAMALGIGIYGVGKVSPDTFPGLGRGQIELNNTLDSLLAAQITLPLRVNTKSNSHRLQYTTADCFHQVLEQEHRGTIYLTHIQI